MKRARRRFYAAMGGIAAAIALALLAGCSLPQPFRITGPDPQLDCTADADWRTLEPADLPAASDPATPTPSDRMAALVGSARD